MVTQLPATMGEFRTNQVQEYREQQTRQRELPRQADARKLLAALALVDRSYRNRTPSEAIREERMTASRIGDTNYTLEELTEGLKLAYQGSQSPWNPVGAIFEAVKSIRADRRKGQAVAELRELSAAPAASGPVSAAYGAAVNHDCPACGAVAGDACRNPSNKDRPRFIPCVRRPRS